ncbi:MAG: isocitrate lyase/phosphoenolpyruvate mutase family protein [Pseudomonadota bacterium]
MVSQAQRNTTFRDLHGSGCFIMPNPWSVGSAKLMAGLGAKALATTSAGHAFHIGKCDMGHVSREEALVHASEIVSATSLPVNGDLENGYGDDPDRVSETIRLASEAGLSGCSIEDTNMADPVGSYDFDLAVERVKAGAAAAKGLSNGFVFTARADGVMLGHYDMVEAIKRCQAFEEAGADVVYLPIPPSIEDLKALCDAVNIPVNCLAAGSLLDHSHEELAAAGARRISLGSSIASTANRAMHDAVKSMLNDGNFTPLKSSISSWKLDALMEAGMTKE